MPKYYVQDKNWVEEYGDFLKDEKLIEIFEFYVLKCPFPYASGMGLNLDDKFINHNIKDTDIVKYIFDSLGLIKDISYFVVNDLSEMEDKINNAQLTDLNGNDFTEKAVIQNKKDSNNHVVGLVVSLLYAIRCGLAHGSFRHILINGDKSLVIENSQYINNKGYEVKGRFVLKYKTLIKLKEVILEGDNGYLKYKKGKDIKTINEIKDKLKNNTITSKDALKKEFGISYNEIEEMCKNANRKIYKENGKYIIK